MGLGIYLLTEDGKVVKHIGDPTNILHRLLPDYDDRSYHQLRFIDWYGDTTFNRLQMEEFLAEWRKLYERVRSVEERELLLAVEALALECQSRVHLYLKFVGD